MCGIVGYCGSGQVDVVDSQLAAASQTMRRRGPDAHGTWRGDGIVLGHRRLSIIDVDSGANQPLSTRDGRLHIVFNGEIYNYRVLRAELVSMGYRFETHSDTEVLLHLYDRFGLQMFKRLRGMYALGIWDSVRKQLLLARDPLGIKPLYFRETKDGLWFASQVRALRVIAPGSLTEDPAGRVGFFLWGHVPEPFTYYEEIRSFPAGEAWLVNQDGVHRRQRFFQAAELFAPSVETRSLRDCLIDTVKHHLEADVEVGMFLSAGIDSATLTALATEVRGLPISAMTLGFREMAGSPGDEVPLATAIADHYGASHAVDIVDKADFDDVIDDVLGEMDQPTIDGVNTYFVSKLCHRLNLKVAISGLGGDELFGGYSGFSRIPEMVRRLRMMPCRSRWGDVLGRVTLPLWKMLGQPKAAAVYSWGGDLGSAYLLNRCLYLPWEIEEFLDPEMVRVGWERLSVLDEIAGEIREIQGDRWKLSWLEMYYYMKAQLLRDSDWAGMAHSVEIRVPLCDVELVRGVVGLGPSVSKADLASTPAIPLPAAVLSRPKTGFSIPVPRWIAEKAGASERGNRPWARYLDSRFAGSSRSAS